MASYRLSDDLPLKTLVLNNYLHDTEIKELTQAIKPFSEYVVVSFKDISQDFELGKDADAILLTGSEASLLESEGAMYGDIAQMILDAEQPILGICFGHQLGCAAFGAEIGTLRKPVEWRFEAVTVVKTDEIFRGFKKGQEVVFAEIHYDYVKRDSLKKAGLQLLAFSQSCETEAVRHKTKPFYGIQFHAEQTRIGGDEHREGLRVIRNFYKVCCRR